MLEKIKREITYVRKNQYGFKTVITIDDKEYLKESGCGKCPFHKDDKCIFKPTITALGSLRDACVTRR